LRALAGLIATAIDRVRWQDEAREARALEEANRLKAELLSILAHEMRTPLASIKGYSTALLLEDVQWEPEKQREFLEIIDAECDNLSEIVRDLLESSTIDAGFLEIEKEPLLLPRLAQQAVREIARRTKIHRFLVTFADDFPMVEADSERIRQVLHNLLDNAVKYSPDGGLIVVRGEVCPSEVIISVADQGVGIAPEDLNRLFDKYFRVKSGSGHRVPGTGLGLPIAQTIVKNHGGRIWAESQLGKGTTLYFSLPLGEVRREIGEE
jgi:signal transduction histidine kinase